jgi:hypothetical protein
MSPLLLFTRNRAADGIDRSEGSKAQDRIGLEEQRICTEVHITEDKNRW